MYNNSVLVLIFIFCVQECFCVHSVYKLVNNQRRYRRNIEIKVKGTLVNQSIAVKEERTSNTDNEINYTYDNHMYYNSWFFKNGENYFIDLAQGEDIILGSNIVTIIKHKNLSNGYLEAVQFRLKFLFPFYGHLIGSVYLTTGGFISVGPIFHTYIHIVHYISPLMANFNPSLSDSSEILIASGDDIFIVQWKDVVINNSSGRMKFNFELIMHKNGTIILAYKDIPIPPNLIRNTGHNFTAGIADGFILSYLVVHRRSKPVYHNYIYSYHKVNFPVDQISNNTAIKMDLLPNCIQLKNCTACLDKTKSGVFTCRWCERLQLCSDTFDWHRQRWLMNDCEKNSFSKSDQCFIYDKIKHNLKQIKGKPLTKKHKSNTWIGIVIGLTLLLVVLLVFVTFYYAYAHPQSRLGMWLIEHRPSRLFKMKDFSSQIDEDQLL